MPDTAPTSTASSAPDAAPTAPDSGPDAPAEPVGDRVEHGLAASSGCASIHAGAVDRLGVRQRVGREAGVGGDEPRGLLGRPGDVLERRTARAAGLQVRDAARRRWWRASSRSRHPGWQPSSKGFPQARRDARQLGQRGLGARGHAPASGGSRSSGAPSGSSYRGNATSPPASRTISCAAATSTARQRLQRDHPVEARRRDLAQRRRRSSRARAAGRPARPAASAASRTQRGSADSMPSSSSLPVAAAALAGVDGRARRSSSHAPLPRRAIHSSSRPEVVARSRRRRRPSSARRPPRPRARGAAARAWR